MADHISTLEAPFIPAHQQLPEITIRVFILGTLLTALLAASNVYLGLKLGVTIAAAIPAAVTSMSILRFFKNYSVLENNIIQTMASAGEAVAAATAFVLPGLIIIGYWQHFDYFTIFCLVSVGGILGVFISIPLRRVMLNHLKLCYPEGTATGQVLKASVSGKNKIKPLWQGGLVGGLTSLCQAGFQIFSDNIQFWTSHAKSTLSLYGIGLGFSPALVAAGYIIGASTGITLLVGVIFGWVIGIPLLAHIYGLPHADTPYAMAMDLWKHHLRFVGVGTMLLGGLWTLLTLLKPVYKGLVLSWHSVQEIKNHTDKTQQAILRTERDIPPQYLLWAGLVFTILIFFGTMFFLKTTPLAHTHYTLYGISAFSAVYALIGGIFIACIAAYMSGVVGMTNTPLSGLLLISILLSASLVLVLFSSEVLLNKENTMAAIVTVLFITALVSVIAAVSGENLQDLKAGQILGATPWKQQFILFVGVIVAAIVVGPILELLFQAYGMGGVFPRAGMATAQMLPAPQAGLMATVTQGVFGSSLPWSDIYLGIGVAFICIIIDCVLKAKTSAGRLPVLAVGLSIYLPPELMVPTIVGGLVNWFVKVRLNQRFTRHQNKKGIIQDSLEKGNLLACGLVAGAALMGVFLAIPFVMMGSSDALKLVPDSFKPIADWLGLGSLIILCVWLHCSSTPDEK